MLGFLLLTALGGLAPEAGQRGDPPPSPAAAQQRIAVRFNPPTDRPLHYRSTRIAASEMPSFTPNPLDMTLLFQRRPDGDYMLTVGYRLPSDAPVHPLVELHREPTIFRVSATGSLLTVEDEAAWLDRLETRLREFSRRENLPEQLAATFMSGFRASSPQARVNQLGRNLLPLLVFASSDFAIGESRMVPVPQMAPLEGPMLQWDTMLESVDAATARFRRELRIDVAAAARRLGASMGVAVPEGVLDQGTSVRVDHLRIDIATGLTDMIESETRLVQGPGDASVIDGWTIERLPD